MAKKVHVRERQIKSGLMYEYRFEVEMVDGKRRFITKGGFDTEEQAYEAGVLEKKRYDNRSKHKKKDVVYIIELPSIGAFKIGKASGNCSRFGEYTLLFEKPVLRLICKVGDNGYAAETEIKRICKDKKMNGEWYKLNDNDILNIQRSLYFYDITISEEERQQVMRDNAKSALQDIYYDLFNGVNSDTKNTNKRKKLEEVHISEIHLCNNFKSEYESYFQ